MTRLISVALAFIIVGAFMQPVMAADQKQDKAARKAEKVKEGIAKLGTGRDAAIKVTLRDKTTVKGFISETRDDDFVLTDEQSGATTTVMYSQVEKVMPSFKMAIKRELAPNRFFKKVAIAALIIVGGSLIYCGASQRCRH